MNYWDIYLIISPNEKKYVGVTKIGYLNRWKEHQINSNSNMNYALHNSIRKYGAQNFQVYLIRTCDSIKYAKEVEKFYIRRYQTMVPKGYNMTSGGDGVRSPCKEIRIKMSAKAKERSQSPTFKEFYREKMKELWKKPEFREKMKDRWKDPIKRANYMKGLRSEKNIKIHKESANSLWSNPEFRLKVSNSWAARKELR